MNALSRMLASLVLGAALLSGAAFAQVPDRVGRIAYLSGDVQFYSESAQAWLPAQLNAPVSSRNSLFTGQDSRAEIRFGGTAVAMDGQTQLDIQILDDTAFKAGVTRGNISLRVPRIEGDESYEVTAPAASYAILQAGRYRVDATDSSSSVSVLAGLVSASVAGGGSAMVEAGQALSAANGGFVRSSARGSAFDSWAAQRDNAYSSSQSARYVSPNMTGYEELDANGRWANDPDYGNVWYPTTYVNPGWVPYRDGHWAFVAPWGWTWIDDAPWGFAPFHYGRWVSIGSRWAWTPGTYVRRPSYAPALVGFIGGSTAVSISIGTQPAVGWYPLPPWERYRPAYDHHDRQVQNINNFNITNAPSNAWRMVEHNRVSVNQVQGATVVPREAFAESRPVRRAALSVPAPVLAAPHVAIAPVVAPTRPGMPAPSGSGRPDFGDRRGLRGADQGRAEQGRGAPVMSNGAALPSRAAESLPPAATPGTDSRPRIFRGDDQGRDRQAPSAVVSPQGREPVPPPRAGNAQPGQAVQPINPGFVRGEPRGENRGAERQVERQAQPAIVVPQASPPAPVPRVDSTQPRQFVQPPASPPEALAPRMRAEPPAARPEPRMEQRVEPRAVPRIEPRVEPRPEPRQIQRVEPPPQARPPPPQPAPQPAPQARPPAPPPPQAQPAAKPTPEQERERRLHGERGREG